MEHSMVADNQTPFLPCSLTTTFLFGRLTVLLSPGQNHGLQLHSYSWLFALSLHALHVLHMVTSGGICSLHWSCLHISSTHISGYTVDASIAFLRFLVPSPLLDFDASVIAGLWTLQDTTCVLTHVSLILVFVVIYNFPCSSNQ